MTILQSLAARYDRLAAEGRASVPGFAPAQISFTIVLDADGNYFTTQDERTGEGKKRRPAVRQAPAAPKRASNIASCSFWDKTSYVFGRTAEDTTVSDSKRARDAERLIREHAAFRTRHEALLTSTNDPGCQALLTFLRNWSPGQYDSLVHAEAMLDQNVAFRLHGEAGFIHDRPAARAALATEEAAREGGAEIICLVTGITGKLARLHPSIKGVPGAQSSGAALVSFNLDSFTSYGRAQGANASVSEQAAFAYTSALNALLTASHTNPKGRPVYPNRATLGETTLVFWAEHGSIEDLVRNIMGDADEGSFDDPTPVSEANETAKLRDVLVRMQDGIPLREAGPLLDAASRVYVLGLSPNAARLSVRFWVEQSFGDFANNFQLHWRDLQIEPPPRPWPPPLWRLMLELAPQRKSENIPAHLSGEIMRAILTGGAYPQALLIQAIMRIRADGDVNEMRVALVKACVTRKDRLQQSQLSEWKDKLVALDKTEENVGYRLGRLFALLDYAQYLSVGSVNAGIKDKFFASASSTPRRIFPSLLRMVQNHLSDARKSADTRDRANHTDMEIKQVMDGLAADIPFPTTLSLDDQGRFIVGFYHQRPGRRTPKADQAAQETTE